MAMILAFHKVNKDTSMLEVYIVLLCCCSVSQSCPTLCGPMDCTCQASLSFTISWSLLKLISFESVMPSNHLVLCRPLLLLPSITSIRVFSSESAFCIRWPKYWSFSISLSNEYSGPISFRIIWFDLLAVQGSFKSLLQHRISSSALSLLYGPAFISIHDYWKKHNFDYMDFYWQK